MNEIVSFLIPVYKEPKEWLEQSISSVVRQTYPNIEIIVVVDDPDNTAIYEVVDRYRKMRSIKVISNAQNYGLVYSLNKGLEYCTGTYVARMDADDVCEPDRIEKQIAFLKREKYDLVGGEILLWNRKILRKRIAVHTNKYCQRMLGCINPIAHPTWLAKKEVFENLEGYREIVTAEDYDFLIRMVHMGYRIGNLPETILRYRVSETSISNARESEQFAIAEYLRTNYKKGIQTKLTDYQNYLESNEFCECKRQMERYKSLKAESRNAHKVGAFLQLALCKVTYKLLFRRVCINSLCFNEWLSELR